MTMTVPQLRRLYEIKADRFNATMTGFGPLTDQQRYLLAEQDAAYRAWAAAFLASQ